MMGCLFLCGLGFLLGFRIAVFIDKKHLERMKKIWTNEP